jgi:hypothetical protein
MGYLLFIIALILSFVLYPLGLVYSFIKLITLFKLKKALKHLNDIFFMCAILVDIMGNVFMKHLFNDLLIKPSSHPFGYSNQTISFVLGINKQNNKLTKLGKLLADLLNLLDKNHVEKAVKKGM